MKNREREDCGLYLGMGFYMSGIETEWWCWSCPQGLLALIGAGLAQCPNKHIIHMTNPRFAEPSTSTPPHTHDQHIWRC